MKRRSKAAYALAFFSRKIWTQLAALISSVGENRVVEITSRVRKTVWKRGIRETHKVLELPNLWLSNPVQSGQNWKLFIVLLGSAAEAERYPAGSNYKI